MNSADTGDGKLTRKEIRARERARLEAEAAATPAAAAHQEPARQDQPEPYIEAAHHVVHEHHAEPGHHTEPNHHAEQDPFVDPDHGYAQYDEPAHHPGQEPYAEPVHVEEHGQHHDSSHHAADLVHFEPEHQYVPARPGDHAPYYAHEDVAVHPAHDDSEYYVYDDEPQHGHQAALPGARTVKAPSPKVRFRRRMLALLLTLAVFVTAIVVGVQFLKPLLGMDKVADYPGPGTGQVQVTVDAGEGTRSFAAKLEAAGVVADADTFVGAFASSGQTLSPGEYSFRQEMSARDAVQVLAGEESAGVVYFALNAGLRINESLTQIADGARVNYSELEALSNAPAQFGLPASAKNLEGFLAPGEYRFEVGTPAKDILQKLVDATRDELVAQGISDPAKQYEAVIVASIVQAEGGLADYSNVAGAIYNRLEPNDETNGYLQVDSAVTYGLGTKSFNFTEEQRTDKSNPYNTYANPGLPPGPIGSPGKTAIDAAAKPADNDYLYWVTINLDTKETKFSSTLAEHNRYVEQYNAWCQANAGRCT